MATISQMFTDGYKFHDDLDTSNKDLYKVDPKKGTNGVYEAVIRFVPFYANPNRSLIRKVVDYVVNPDNGRGIYVDDPSSVGDPSSIRDMFFAIMNVAKKNDLENYKKFAREHLSNNPQYTSLIQIIEDKQRPDLVGKIMVFSFGNELFQKFDAEDKVVSKTNPNPCAPHDPVHGRLLNLVCRKKPNSSMNTYIDSAFYTPEQSYMSAMWIYDNDGKPSYVTDETEYSVLMDYLSKNSPDLSKYEYRPMNQDQANFVEDALKSIAKMFTAGTIGMSTTNVGFAANGGFQVNQNPVFAGASQPGQGYGQMQQAPMNVAQPAYAQAPARPPMPPTVTSANQAPMNSQAPVAPVSMPQMPVTPSAAPQAPAAPMVSQAPAAPAMPVTTAQAPAAPVVAPQGAPQSGVQTPTPDRIRSLIDSI